MNKEFLKGIGVVVLTLVLLGAYLPGSVVENEDGSIAGGQSNVGFLVNAPYSFDGTNWTRAGCTPTPIVSAASTNATSVKGSAGIVYAAYMTNSNTTNTNFRYVKFYNKASSPTVGSDTPVAVFGMPGTGGGALPIPPSGMNFSLGVALAMTTGAAHSDTNGVALNEVVLTLCYK